MILYCKINHFGQVSFTKWCHNKWEGLYQEPLILLLLFILIYFHSCFMLPRATQKMMWKVNLVTKIVRVSFAGIFISMEIMCSTVKTRFRPNCTCGGYGNGTFWLKKLLESWLDSPNLVIYPDTSCIVSWCMQHDAITVFLESWRRGKKDRL